MDCLGLKKVVIPGSVEWIENFAFWDCKNVTIILKKHKNEFKGIGETSFLGCKSVEYVEEKNRTRSHREELAC